MYTVYILHSAKYQKTYVGFTSDLSSRLESHNHLATKGWTINYRPWTLLYTEIYETKRDAMAREKELKSGHGRVFIKSLLNDNS
jgi:putative endonuclease